MKELAHIDLSGIAGNDPLANVDLNGTVEEDAKKETSAVLEAFRARAKREEKRMRDATDSEYWFAVCFGNRDEKEQFLHALGMMAHGDKYIDGRKLAEAMGISLDKTDFKATVSGKRPAFIKSVGVHS